MRSTVFRDVRLIIFTLVFASCCLYEISSEGFPSTQRYLSSFYYLFFSRYMFRSYDHLQVEMQWKLTRLTTDPLFFF
jgi:hypothetical protein